MYIYNCVCTSKTCNGESKPPPFVRCRCLSLRPSLGCWLLRRTRAMRGKVSVSSWLSQHNTTDMHQRLHRVTWKRILSLFCWQDCPQTRQPARTCLLLWHELDVLLVWALKRSSHYVWYFSLVLSLVVVGVFPTVKTWKILTFVVAVPGVAVSWLNAHLKGQQHSHEQPEFVPYSHLRVRTKVESPRSHSFTPPPPQHDLL